MQLPLFEKDDAGPSPRGPHPSGRNRCQMCTTRNAISDGKRPSCLNCALQRQTCVYGDPFEYKASSNQPREKPPSSSDAISNDQIIAIKELVASLPGCDPVEMKIIWHFTTYTCSSFCSGIRRLHGTIRRNVLQHAVEARFLMRSVLALSCLHASSCTLKDLGDARRYDFYQSESLREYRLAIEAAEPETFGALLVNSLLVTATSSENFRLSYGPNLYILQWMLIWRGIRVIFDRTKGCALHRLTLTRLLYRPSMDLKEAVKHVPQKLMTLIGSIPQDDADFVHKATYLHGLKYLGTLYQHLREDGINPIMKLRIITWFTFLPPSLIDLFREKRERALVILAHYAVFLKLAAGVWWLRGAGQSSLQDICNYLAQAWHTDLVVPLRAIRTANINKLKKLLLDDPLCDQFKSLLSEDWRRREWRSHVCLVDDEGRPVFFSWSSRDVELEMPSEPGEKPVWNTN